MQDVARPSRAGPWRLRPTRFLSAKSGHKGSHGRIHHPAPALDDPGPAARHPDDVPDDAAHPGEPVPALGARGLPGDAGEPRAEVQPRQALVRPVRALREGRGDVRPRAVARPAQPERERHREGALPEVARARVPGDAVRDRLRDPAGGDRGVTPEHGLRLRGDVLLERRVRGPELPDRDAPHLLLRAQVGRHLRPADERVDGLAVEDPARDRPRARPDGLLRAARARDDAGDAPAGLRAHREGEGPQLAPDPDGARPQELADARR